MSRSALIRQIPNALTLLNALMGISAIWVIVALDFPLTVYVAVALIAIGAVVDFLDGYCARRLGAESEMGKQLDSFSDLITFGIAPVALLHHVAVSGQPVVIAASFAFLIAGIFRLARHNLCGAGCHFIGLPITAAGMLLALYCLMYALFASSIFLATDGFILRVAVTTIIVCLLAGLMVSCFKIKRIKQL